jgi:hypothetical protein
LHQGAIIFLKIIIDAKIYKYHQVIILNINICGILTRGVIVQNE